LYTFYKEPTSSIDQWRGDFLPQIDGMWGELLCRSMEEVLSDREGGE
jgi:hypothetical protein